MIFFFLLSYTPPTPIFNLFFQPSKLTFLNKHYVEIFFNDWAITKFISHFANCA